MHVLTCELTERRLKMPSNFLICIMAEYVTQLRCFRLWAITNMQTFTVTKSYE